MGYFDVGIREKWSGRNVMKKLCPDGCLVAILLIALASASLSRDAFCEDSSRTNYTSERPLFARISLTEDGSKVLAVAFDESQGTKKGYDVVCVDITADGKVEKSGRLRAKVKSVTSGPYRLYCTFPPIRTGIPYNEEAEKVAAPSSISFRYTKYATEKAQREYFYLDAAIMLKADSADWTYMFRGVIQPSEDRQKARLIDFAQAPELKITTRPDPNKKGNLGIGLDLSVRELDLLCMKGGVSPKAHVTIKDADGEAIHRASADIRQFAFG
jgi:hypothetical protein